MRVKLSSLKNNENATRSYSKDELNGTFILHPHDKSQGDGPKDLLIAPLWASRKREVLNMLHHRMKEEQSYQGRLFSH